MDYLDEHFTQSIRLFSLRLENVLERTITTMFKIRSEITFFFSDVDSSAEDRLVYRYKSPQEMSGLFSINQPREDTQ